jgi:hypothetical protein
VGEPGNPEEEASLMQMRERKRQLAAAAEHFNREGKKSFKLLQDLGVLPDPLTPESVVRFLRETPNLDKTNVGAFLGGEKELNQQVLAAFVNSFDFSKLPTCSPPALAAPPAPAPAAPPAQAHTAEGEAAAAPEGAPHAAAPAAEPANAPPSSQPAESAIVAAPFVTIDAAMRFLLQTFRLPGEAQQIARIMQAFAARFFEQCPGPLADKDAAFVLAYSVIMLHTDAHSKKIRRKMTKEEFVRNNRGINAGRDLPRWYVEALYDSVVQNEIRLTDSEIEADGEFVRVGACPCADASCAQTASTRRAGATSCRARARQATSRHTVRERGVGARECSLSAPRSAARARQGHVSARVGVRRANLPQLPASAQPRRRGRGGGRGGRERGGAEWRGQDCAKGEGEPVCVGGHG